MRLSSLPACLLLCAAGLSLAPQEAAAQYRTLTPEENRNLCEATRPHYESPPFTPTEEGLKAYINSNPYRFSSLEKREVVGFDYFSYYFPDYGRMSCLSNSISASGWGRISDPRGVQVCRISIKWNGRHVASREGDGTLNFKAAKPVSYRYFPNTCRWQ